MKLKYYFIFLVITGATSSALQYGDFTYLINSTDTNTVTVTDYTGSDIDVDIPPLIDGRNVTHIGNDSFSGNKTLQVVSIPHSVVEIGDSAFSRCSELSDVVWTQGITNIQSRAFSYCEKLTHISIPGSVIRIEGLAFYRCENLATLAIPRSVMSIGRHTFEDCYALTTVSILGDSVTLEQGSFNNCPNLTGVYCHTNAPAYESGAFMGGTTQATVYYRPDTAGWSNSFDSLPTEQWNPAILIDDVDYGIQTNGFSFNISESQSGLVVVEGCTNLIDGMFKPMQTNSMAGTTNLFSDANWTNHPSFFYQLSMP